MKTTNYKTGNVMKSVVASLIILASFSVISRGKNSGKEASRILINESALQIESTVKYNAAQFAETEVALEIENWMNGNASFSNEASETEATIQVEPYNAREFVEAEMTLEIENQMNSNEETINAAILIEPVQYNAAKFVEAEMLQESCIYSNSNEKGTKEQITCNNNLAYK